MMGMEVAGPGLWQCFKDRLATFHGCLTSDQIRDLMTHGQILEQTQSAANKARSESCQIGWDTRKRAHALWLASDGAAGKEDKSRSSEVQAKRRMKKNPVPAGFVRVFQNDRKSRPICHGLVPNPKPASGRRGAHTWKAMVKHTTARAHVMCVEEHCQLQLCHECCIGHTCPPRPKRQKTLVMVGTPAVLADSSFDSSSDSS